MQTPREKSCGKLQAMTHYALDAMGHSLKFDH
jgi:hypothetical protein